MLDPRYRALEEPIENARNMSEILSQMLENDGSNGVLLGNSLGLKNEQVVVSDKSWGLIVFAVHHLQALIEEVRTLYHRRDDVAAED